MKKSMQKENLIIFLKNFAMTITVITIVVILVFLTQGWTLDPKGSFERNGLVQFFSSVTGATIEIGDQKLAEKTNTKTLLSAGTHEFKIWKEGYETWYRKTQVKEGEILWLNYARLIPKQKRIDSFLDIQNLKTAKVLPNKEKILIAQEDNKKSIKFSLINLQNDTPNIKELGYLNVLQENNSKENSISNVEIQEISRNNNRFIFTYNQNGSRHWLIGDVNNPSKFIDISKDFNLNNIAKIEAKNNEASILYIQDGQNLKELNVDSLTLSANILTNIETFTSRENIIASVQKKTNSENNTTYSIHIRRDNKNMLIKDNIPTAPTIALGRYYNESYVHVAIKDEIHIYKSSNWSELMRLYKKIKANQDITSLNINDESRLLAIKTNSSTLMHDLETKETFTLDNNSPNKPIWIDNFHLANVTNNSLSIVDFDGANKHSLMPSLENMPIVLSGNDKFLYTLSTNSNGNISLLRLRMILE